jgi:hypothetical protein
MEDNWGMEKGKNSQKECEKGHGFLGMKVGERSH